MTPANDITGPARRRGLSIFPLRPKGKEPLVSQKLARPDYPIPDGHNYGVVATDEFCILDIDDPEKFTVVFPELAVTYTVASRRGLHLYFKQTEASRRLGNKSVNGVFDFMGKFPKYVVGEGSTHPSGAIYTGVHDVDIFEIPDGMVAALEMWPGADSSAPGFIPDHRKEMLSLCGKEWDGEKDRDTLLEFMLEKNAEADIPLSTGDIVRMVDYAVAKWEPNKGPGKPLTVGKGKGSVNTDPEWSLESFGDIEATPIEWIWTGYVAVGKISTLNGEPGCGKSMITIDVAARMTTGREWPDKQENTFPPSDVLLLTLEEDAADTIKPRIVAAGGDPDRIHRITCGNRAAFFKIERDRDRLVKIFQAKPIRLVILDPMLDFVQAESNTNKDVRETLNTLADLAAEYRFGVMGVSHLNKKSDLKAMQRVAGANGWVAVARINYLVGYGEDKDGKKVRHLCPLKLNLTEAHKSLDFSVVQHVVSTGKLLNVGVAKVEWLGESETSADVF